MFDCELIVSTFMLHMIFSKLRRNLSDGVSVEDYKPASTEEKIDDVKKMFRKNLSNRTKAKTNLRATFRALPYLLVRPINMSLSIFHQ